MPDLKLLALAKQLQDRAEEALVRAETFHDPDCKRLMRQIAATYEELAERLKKEGARWTVRNARLSGRPLLVDLPPTLMIALMVWSWSKPQPSPCASQSCAGWCGS
jgi:hypothetical protein